LVASTAFSCKQFYMFPLFLPSCRRSNSCTGTAF
jgi:hypothetical protein